MRYYEAQYFIDIGIFELVDDHNAMIEEDKRLFPDH